MRTYLFRVPTYVFRMSTYVLRMSTYVFRISTYAFRMSTLRFRMSTYAFRWVSAGPGMLMNGILEGAEVVSDTMEGKEVFGKMNGFCRRVKGFFVLITGFIWGMKGFFGMVKRLFGGVNWSPEWVNGVCGGRRLFYALMSGL